MSLASFSYPLEVVDFILEALRALRLLPGTLIHFFFFFFFFFISSLTAVPSESQCLSSGAYEWPVLVSLKHAVGLSQHCFLLQEWLSKLMACSPTCELHSRHLGCGLELILAVYREVHAHSFVLKCLLQWHVHAQHY